MIEKIPAIFFTFELWNAGSLQNLNIKLRENTVHLYKNQIKKYAIGYTEGNSLSVRPKINYKAVMFFYKNEHFWTHLTNKEFKLCFQ